MDSLEKPVIAIEDEARRLEQETIHWETMVSHVFWDSLTPEEPIIEPDSSKEEIIAAVNILSAETQALSRKVDELKDEVEGIQTEIDDLRQAQQVDTQELSEKIEKVEQQTKAMCAETEERLEQRLGDLYYGTNDRMDFLQGEIDKINKELKKRK